MSIIGANGIYEYSLGAKLAYDKFNDEVYLVNPSYDYSYAYNIPTKSWIKRGETFSDVFNLAQDSYATRYSTDMAYRFFEDYSLGVMPALFETKPISLDSADFKKINRIYLRGSYEPESGTLDNVPGFNKMLGAYLWVSVDGRNYTLLQAKQITEACNDIMFNRFPFAVKYFVIILCGHMTKESYITHIDIDYDDVFNTKLR